MTYNNDDNNNNNNNINNNNNLRLDIKNAVLTVFFV